MTASNRVTEAEIRSIAGEMVSDLRIVSEGINPLSRSGMRSLIIELEHQLAQLSRLSDQLSSGTP